MLIVLVAVHPYPSPQAVPLANAFLRSYLDASAVSGSPVEVVLRDYFLDGDLSDCISELAALKPALIGFSMYAWNRERCRSIALGVRGLTPDVRFFAGGPEATADPPGVLEELLFDFLVVGEGEETFAVICASIARGEDLTGIPGVATLGGNGFRLTRRSPLEELDAIPSPWLTGVLDARQYGGVLWQLSRGCGFACDFCFDSHGERGVRCFSPGRIEAELRHFAELDVPQVFVLDSTFNRDVGRAKAILRMIGKHAPRIHFHFEVRCEFIDREMARLFGGICCSLQIGLQSADPAVLREVGRKFSRETFVERVSLLNETGAVFGFDLMYGLPGDSLPGFRESMDFALALYPNHMDIFPLAVLPGTPLADRSEALGLRHLPRPPYTLLSSPTFGPADLAKARQLALACDLFYSRGKAVAWFNSVMVALEMKPSVFLERFGHWLLNGKGEDVREEDLDDDNVWLLQRAFLCKMFEPDGLRSLLPLVLDLVDYHHHYAAAMSSPPLGPADGRFPEQSQLLENAAHLAPSARLAKFSHEILDILEAGEPDIREFVLQAEKCPSWAVIYPRRDGVATESLIEPYFRLLELADGHTPCGRIAAAIGLPDDDALSFLEFAAEEGILIFHCCGG